MSSEQGQKTAARMVATAMEWFDDDTAKLTVNECVKFSQKLIQSLMKDDLTAVKSKDKSQMLAYVGKTLDQVARLTQYSQGQPDSRQEITIGQLLQHLTPAELSVFDAVLLRLESSSDTGVQKPLLTH